MRVCVPLSLHGCLHGVSILLLSECRAAFEREGQFLKTIQQGNSRQRWMPEFYGSGLFIVDSQRVPWCVCLASQQCSCTWAQREFLSHSLTPTHTCTGCLWNFWMFP